jgi:hypothetical protein
VIELWLERTEKDPLTDPSKRVEAEVDLAALHLLEGEPQTALEVLGALDQAALVDPSRAELVRAVALQDVGKRSAALVAARRARAGSPNDLLPLVHQAMLLGAEGNTTQERQVWELLLEIDEQKSTGSDGTQEASIDVADLLIRLHANARLQRLNAERAGATRRKDGTP